jgi:hypothetical protein
MRDRIYYLGAFWAGALGLMAGPTDPKSGVPATTTIEAGTVWECECGVTWKVRYHFPRNHGMVPGNRWFRERRRERRKRLSRWKWGVPQ